MRFSEKIRWTRTIAVLFACQSIICAQDQVVPPSPAPSSDVVNQKSLECLSSIANHTPTGSVLPSGMFIERTLTVPMLTPHSKRDAEIWVSCPDEDRSHKKIHPYVSINFTEYPPEGSFRIFKTKIPTIDKRRYYISARYHDGNKWKRLIPAGQTTDLSFDELGRSWSFSLAAGETKRILFKEETTDSDGLAAPTPNEIVQSLSSLSQNISELRGSVQDHSQKLETLNEAINKSTTTTSERLEALSETISSLNDRTSSHEAAERSEIQLELTRTFYIRPEDKDLLANVSITDGTITKVNSFTGLQSLNVIAEPIHPSLTQDSYLGYVTFHLMDAAGQEYLSSNSTDRFPVKISNKNSQLGFEIPFQSGIDEVLKSLLKDRPLGSGEFLVKPHLELIDHVNNSRISGAMRNSLVLTCKE